MNSLVKTVVFAVSLVASGSAWTYGGGGGGSTGCSEPKFFEPAPTGSVSRLGDFTFVASDNTDTSTLTVEINGLSLKPDLVRRGNGEWRVKATLPEPISQPGQVRIALKAKSRDGCWGFQPYYVDIQP
jgi:hypothetical protein